MPADSDTTKPNAIVNKNNRYVPEKSVRQLDRVGSRRIRGNHAIIDALYGIDSSVAFVMYEYMYFRYTPVYIQRTREKETEKSTKRIPFNNLG